MKYHVVIKLNTVFVREIEADSEDDLYDAVHEAHTPWGLDDVAFEEDIIEEIKIYDENENMRKLLY